MPVLPPTTEADVIALINSYIVDNTTNQIVPSKLRAILLSMAGYIETVVQHVTLEDVIDNGPDPAGSGFGYTKVPFIIGENDTNTEAPASLHYSRFIQFTDYTLGGDQFTASRVGSNRGGSGDAGGRLFLATTDAGTMTLESGSPGNTDVALVSPPQSDTLAGLLDVGKYLIVNITSTGASTYVITGISNINHATILKVWGYNDLSIVACGDIIGSVAGTALHVTWVNGAPPATGLQVQVLLYYKTI